MNICQDAERENEAERTLEINLWEGAGGPEFLRKGIYKIYECDEQIQNHSLFRGPVEACVSECMTHDGGGKAGGVLHETESLIGCICLQIRLEWAWAQGLREAATVQGYPTVSTAKAPNH